MIRTIIYPPKPGITLSASAQPADDIPAKLVKYIPAEICGLYAAVYALVPHGTPDDLSQNRTYLVGVLIFSMVLTMLYFLARADKDQPPRWWFYPLTVIAFLAWALGTSTVGRDVFDWPSFIGEGAILCAVVFVPLVDEACTRWLPASVQWP